MAAFVLAVASLVVTAALGYLMIVAAASVAGAIARGGRRERAADAYQALAISRFTIPVSVIVPLDRDAETLPRCIDALLGSNYPHLEVIVVAESMAEGALDALKKIWALEPRELFYRRTLSTSDVNRILSSDRDDRLMLIDKVAAGRADALNCGVSFARYRYVVSVNPDVEFDQDALLRLMSPALRDPGAVLAVTSYVERRPQSAQLTTHSLERSEWIRAGDDYQRLASIRSWMASRLAWHQLRCGLPPRDGVTAWRRDAVMELGGFSVSATDPELDLLVRLQTSQGDGPAGRVVRTSEVFGHTATLTVRGAAALASRRQSALIEALRTFRGTRRNPAVKMMRIVVGMELATSLAQGLVAVLIVGAAAAGWVSWRAPYLTFLLLTFGYAVVSASALLLRGGTPGAPTGGDLKRLLLRAPLEFAVYRPALVWARLSNR
jgi:cellulose synthase/poly-beta-1,6-N-acetylglucosamine synthase-like glycosyltransferase